MIYLHIETDQEAVIMTVQQDHGATGRWVVFPVEAGAAVHQGNRFIYRTCGTAEG